jgi:hypothetical protein
MKRNMPILPMVSRTVDGVVVESQDERQENILIFQKNHIAVLKKYRAIFKIFCSVKICSGSVQRV